MKFRMILENLVLLPNFEGILGIWRAERYDKISFVT